MAQQATQAELNRQMRNLQRSWEDAKAQNRDIEGKIEQLEEARRHVRAAKEHAGAVKQSVRNLKVDDSWKGRARTRLDNECSSGMYTDAERFHDCIGNLDGEIGSKIWDLRFQVNYLVKLIAGIEDGINSASRELNKLLSDGN